MHHPRPWIALQARGWLAATGLSVVCLTSGQAAETVPRESVVSFSTSAQVEVTTDLLGIRLQAVREGNDAATVQAQLKQVLDAALTEAKKAAQPGALEVRTGNFSLFPRYARDNRISGWQGQAELLLEGKDSQRVAAVAGRLTSAAGGMTMASVGYSISRELAEKYEADVTAQAIAKFRAKAADYAKQFGCSGFQLRDINVQSAEQGSGPRPPIAYAKAMSMASDAAVPVEPGKGQISATVSGSVALTK